MSDADELRRLHAENERLRAAQQEPVLVVEREPGYWSRGHYHEGTKPHIDPTKVWNLPIGTKLYTAPPQQKPLTDEEIEDIWNRFCDELGEASINDAIEIARAIERAHGIGKEEK